MTRQAPTEMKPDWGDGMEYHRRSLVEQNISSDSLLLDYGCGQGAYVHYFNSKGIKCIGADLFEYPKWEAISAELGVVKNSIFSCIYDAKLPFNDNEFDIVFSFEVLEHCPDPEKTLRELKRVAKSSLILSVPDCNTEHLLRRHSLSFSHWTDTSHVNFYTADSFVQLLQKNNFVIRSVGNAYKINLNSCFWDHLRIPAILKRTGHRLVEKLDLMPTYYSSILVHADKINE